MNQQIQAPKKNWINSFANANEREKRMKLNFNETVEELKIADNILILMHQFPDGDTIGSGFALCRALQSLGKRVKTACAHEYHDKYNYITTIIEIDEFEPEFIVAVDVADIKLLGTLCSVFENKIDLCIDHHASNTFFAEKTFLDDKAAATCEMIYHVIVGLCGDVDYEMANALYTGITTDTGCFRFSNTSANTHLVTASLMGKGIDCSEINRIMFDTKSLRRLKLEQAALSSMVFGESEKSALISITKKQREKLGVDDSDLEGITSLPRQVEGVLIGMTVREREENICKVSVRTHSPLNAAEFCKNFGGGGHDRAAGCEIQGELKNIQKLLLEKAEETLAQLGLK